MKKAWIVLLLSILMTACSTPQNEALNSESDSEMVEAATAIVTEATTTTTTVTTLTQTVSKPVETAAVKEVIKINMEDISDYVYDGETQTVGNDTYGYMDIPIEFEYEEDDHGKPIMAYSDNKGNRIYMKNCDLIGFGITYKDIDKLAECYNSTSRFKDAETMKYEIDGYIAYKETYSRLEAIDSVNYGDEYTAHWIFECEDGVNRSIGFSGSEDFIERSDNIIKTYHLYN